MNNEEMIATALELDLINEMAECEALHDHKFSLSFDRKMKKLLQSNVNDNSLPLHIGKRAMTAIIIAASLLLLMGAAATTYVLWDHFHMQDLSLHTLLNISDVENCPKTLECHYKITADLSAFSENVIYDDEYAYFVEYRNEEQIFISFMQQTKHGITYALNTEDMDPPVEVMVNNCKGIYNETKYGSHVLIWDTGDYLLELAVTRIGKNELFSLAETVKKVE